MKGKMETKTDEPRQGKRILVSFNHSVSIVLNGRAICVYCAVCEELFVGKTIVSAKDQRPSAEEAMNQAHELTLDFPIMLKIISLSDGKPLKKQPEVMVKWNNISAICFIKDGELQV